MLFAPHQKRNWKNTVDARHRWNVSEGATRSGKTYMDYYKVPARIRAADHDGLIVLMGNTQGTLERNILAPLRNIWGGSLVGTIGGASNKVKLFGREAYALGADKQNAVTKIQGAGIAYCYGDEVATWAEPVFQMLKSRLDKPDSCFDGTTNPDNPKHWLHTFLQSDADIYRQRFTLDENPFVSDFFKEQLKKEYAGTVYYDRFINGLWVAAEGIIYRAFADNPEAFIIPEPKPEDVAFCTIGVDFGGTGSAQAFQCTGFPRMMNAVYTLDEYYTKEPIDPQGLSDAFVDFVKRQTAKRRQIVGIYADSAESVLIRGLQTALVKAGLPFKVQNAKKGSINDRIRFYSLLQGAGRYKVVKGCTHTVDAFSTVTWKPGALRDERLDDGTYNIDTLDAQEYSTEAYQDKIQKILLLGG